MGQVSRGKGSGLFPESKPSMCPIFGSQWGKTPCAPQSKMPIQTVHPSSPPTHL